MLIYAKEKTSVHQNMGSMKRAFLKQQLYVDNIINIILCVNEKLSLQKRRKINVWMALGINMNELLTNRQKRLFSKMHPQIRENAVKSRPYDAFPVNMNFSLIASKIKIISTKEYVV